MNGSTRIASCALAAALLLGACPPFADAGALSLASPAPLQNQAPTLESDAAVSLSDGTYAFDSIASSTGMVTPNGEDGPATVVVKGGRVALVLDIYNPDKYDGLWAGKRSEAPADPYDPSVVNASMVPAGDYAGPTNTWTDSQGVVGEAGATYKAARFVVAMSLAEFAASFGDGADGTFYFAIRRAPWSPSNAGKWMGSGDHYLTLSGLERVSDSTDVPGGFPDDDATEETALARARRLIDAIPYDPYKVALADADAIHAAEDAYAKLTAFEQQQLDAQEAANGVLTYGRSLQCASWGLAALSPVDDSTPLPDGTYTSQVTSTCEMGKSSSNRGYKFTVAKVTVANGHATATLEHGTTSPDTVSLGGVLYPHSNADEKAHSTFEVPVDLNSTFHFSQMAKNPTANTIAIPYEMTVAIDELGAVPDPVSPPEGQGEAAVASSSDDGADEGSTNPGTTAGKGKRTSKARSSRQASRQQARQPSSSAGSASSTTAASGGSGAGRSSGAAAGDGARRSAGPSATDAAAANAAAAEQAPAARQAPAASAEGASSGGRAGVATPAVAAQAAVESRDRPDYLPTLIAGAAVLAAAGFAAFALGYMRRNREPVRVRGVRLPDERG